jgi:protein-S-isoprenylcysteine O-methyltransferase Ste14
VNRPEPPAARLSTSSWLLVELLAVIFPSVYHYVIFGEEEKLECIFGSPYRRC